MSFHFALLSFLLDSALVSIDLLFTPELTPYSESFHLSPALISYYKAS
jgi:hypothetical protein